MSLSSVDRSRKTKTSTIDEPPIEYPKPLFGTENKLAAMQHYDSPFPIQMMTLNRKVDNPSAHPLITVVPVNGKPFESFFRAVVVGLCNKLQECERMDDGVPLNCALAMAEDSMFLGLREITRDYMMQNENAFKDMYFDMAKEKGTPWYLHGLDHTGVAATNWVERCLLVMNDRLTPTEVEITAASLAINRCIIVVQDSSKHHMFSTAKQRTGTSPILIRLKYGCSIYSGSYQGVVQAQRLNDMDAVQPTRARNMIRAFDMLPNDTMSPCIVQNLFQSYDFPDPKFLQSRREIVQQLKLQEEINN